MPNEKPIQFTAQELHDLKKKWQQQAIDRASGIIFFVAILLAVFFGFAHNIQADGALYICTVIYMLALQLQQFKR